MRDENLGILTLGDPGIVARSPERFTLWDDCVSFPDHLVRVRRHADVLVRFTNEVGEGEEWPHPDRALSELLQHEIDYLDGILAVDRALDRASLVLRRTFARLPEYFAAMVGAGEPGGRSEESHRGELPPPPPATQGESPP